MWFRSRSDNDFADEIGAHVDIETDRLIAGGMTPADARAAAVRAFGNRTAARERFHESRGRVLFEQLMQDLRYAWRSLRRTPAFTIIATLCLAVGISVNTTAFSVLNAIMFRDFPGVERQKDLANVMIGFEASWGRSSPAYAAVEDWELLRTGMPAFSGVAAYNNLQLSVRVSGEPQALRGDLVSDNFFEVLGTRPAVGRFMTPRDDPRDVDHIVVISHRYWQRAFDGRQDIAGQVVTIGTRAFTVIGVAPEGFFGLQPGEVVDPDVGTAELFIPLAAARYLRVGSTAPGSAASLGDRWLQVFGRLRPGATLAEARVQANGVAARIAAAYPVERKNAFAAVGRADGIKNAAEALAGVLFVMAVPVIILLVACANLANQLLARAIQRGREIAVRLSLGATRGRVVRQLLTETALLATIASGIGVLLARWLLDALRVWFIAFPFRIPIDVRVLAFTLGLALATALAFGLVPALRATRTDLTNSLKDGAAGSGYRRSRLRSALVIVQIAASLALITVSTVFVRAAERPRSKALDELEHHSLLVSVNLDLLGFDSAQGRAYQESMMERLGRVPGVAAVGMAPFSMFDMLGGYPMTKPGQDPTKPRYSDLAEVSGAWFDATAARPVRGRLFTDAERAARSPVMVVDEEFARRWWRADDPLGQTLRLGTDSAAHLVTVIGVIPTRQEVTFRAPEGLAFIPGGGEYKPRSYFYVKTSAASESMIEPVRQAVRAGDPRVPVLWVRTLEDVAALDASPMTMLASGMAVLGTVALALAALGLFGVLAFIVAQRRYEIGIRVALGARRVDVTWMVLKQALALGAGGVLAGAGVAVVAVVFLRAIIHGLQPMNPSVFGGISLIMVAVAALSSIVPARRAASVDPMRALRTE